MAFSKTVITTVTAVIVVLCIVGGTLAPFALTTYTEGVEAVNDGGGWLKVDYGLPTESIEIDITGDNLTVGTQSGEADDMIVAAWPSGGIFVEDGDLMIMIDDNGTMVVTEITGATITPATGGITVAVGPETWTISGEGAYVMPAVNGQYASYAAGEDLIKTDANDVVALGHFAGVYAFGNTVVGPNGIGDLGLTLNADVQDNVINSVTWARVLTDSAKSVNPVEIDKKSDSGTKSVPSGGTVDAITNEWRFEKLVDESYNETGEAKILAYIGIDKSVIEIPSVVRDGGTNTDYTVTEIGWGTATGNVFETTITGKVIVPDSVTAINWGAFRGTSITDVVLPDSVVSIGSRAFRESAITNINLPDSLTTIEDGVFYKCTNLTYTILPDSLTSIGAGAFEDCSNLKEVLNLSSMNITTTSYGLRADEVHSDVPANVIVAQATKTTLVTEGGFGNDTLGDALVITVIAAIFISSAMVFIRRDD